MCVCVSGGECEWCVCECVSVSVCASVSECKCMSAEVEVRLNSAGGESVYSSKCHCLRTTYIVVRNIIISILET